MAANEVDDRLTARGAGESVPATEREDEATSLDILSDYECPECGPVVDPDDPIGLTEDEALFVLGGDANGFLRCPNDWCDEELEPTLAASIDMLRLLAERMPEAAGEIEQQVAAALGVATDGR